MLANFLVSAVIFYCRSEVIVFRFYKELNGVRSKNSELSREVLHKLPVFGEIIVYLYKMISIAEKVHIAAIGHKNHKFCQY